MRSRGLLASAFVVLGLLLAACGQPAPRAGPPVLRLGYFPNLTHAPALVGVERGFFQTALGDQARLDIKTFNAGPAMIEALFAGEIDIGFIGPNPAINGYVRSQGQALRIIAGAMSGGAAFVVRPESGINGPEGLANRSLATPQLGNTQDVALRYYLMEHGLATRDQSGTVTITPAQNPDILTLFKEGRIDGAWVPEPWATRLVLEAGGRVFLDERDLWPDGRFVTTHVIASTTFLSTHPELVRAFLRGHVQAVQFIQQNPDTALTIVNSEIERMTTRPLPPEVLTRAFANVEVTCDPLPATLFVSAEHAFELGFLGETRPDLSGIYDLALLNEVLREQGLAPLAQP